MDTAVIATAGLLGFGLLVAHNVADHWVQTEAQARDKSLPGWLGRLACTAHVASYTVVLTIFTFTLVLIFHLPISLRGVILGLAVSAVSHYWADRHFTLAKLCDNLGKGSFYRLGMPRQVVGVRITTSDGRETVRPYRSTKNHQPEGLEVAWDNPTLSTGAYALDQSWHWFWIFVTTIVMVML